MKQVAGRLRLDLAQYRELAAFAQFGSDLDKATKASLDRGQRTVEVLKQPQYSPVVVEEQIIIIYTAINGHIDDVAMTDVAKFESDFIKFLRTNHPEIGKTIRETKVLSAETENALKAAIQEFKETFITSDKTAR